MTGIALAYDRSTFNHADRQLLERLIPRVDIVKVGLEAFTAAPTGMLVCHYVNRRGGKTLEDWKMHDIGTTMRKAAANLVNRTMGFTIHAAAAKAGLEDIARLCEATGTIPFGVTVLTDIDTEECISLFDEKPADQVCHFAEKLINAGIPGLVCSGQELAELRKRGLLTHFKTLVPGTRPSWAPADDQKRTMTYRDVAELGATWTVVGRVALQAKDPVAIVERVRRELDGA